MLASLQRIDLRNVELRALAEPLAVISPIALIASGQEFVMSGVAILFLWHSWRLRDFSWARESWFAALLVLWGYAFLRTLVWQPTATGVLTALQWIHFGVYAAALSRWILPDPRARDRLLYATAIAAAFFACDSLMQYFVGFDIIGRRAFSSERLTSVFPKPFVGIEIAWLYLPALLGLWSKGKPWLAAAFGCVCAAAVLLSGDRMGFLVLICSGLLAGLFTRALRRPLLIFLPVVAAIAAALFIHSPTMYQRQVASTADLIEHLGESHYGIIFNRGFAMARAHPLFGVGVRGYQADCLDERYGPPTVEPSGLPRCEGHPHNIYLQWLVETGALGLAAYLAFVALTLLTILRAAKANAGNVILYALAAALALRFWPLAASTSFYSSWSSAPLFLMLGWAMSYCPPLALKIGRAPSTAAPPAHERFHAS